MQTMIRAHAHPANGHRATRAERIVERIKAMPIEDVRARLSESRQMTAEEIVARQVAERRQRAEEAVARLLAS